MHLRGFWLKKTHYNKFDSRICFIMSIHFENKIHCVCFIINYMRTTFAQNISLRGLITLFLL